MTPDEATLEQCLEAVAEIGYSNALLMVRGSERVIHLTKPGMNGTTKAGRGATYLEAARDAAKYAYETQEVTR